METTFLTPLAGLGDILEVLLPIIFLILAGLGQLLSGKDSEKPKPKRRPRPKEQGGDVAVAGEENVEEKLRHEVEQFMRRVQGKDKEGKKADRPKEPPPEPARRPVVAEQSRRRPRDPLEEPRRPPVRQQKESRPASSKPPRTETVTSELRSERVAEHVGRPLRGAQEIAAQTSELAHDVEQADERMEARLQQTFDHQLGSLARQDTGQPAADVSPAGESIATEILAMMSRPDGMRQLIVANEILRRPEERWNE